MHFLAEHTDIGRGNIALEFEDLPTASIVFCSRHYSPQPMTTDTDHITLHDLIYDPGPRTRCLVQEEVDLIFFGCRIPVIEIHGIGREVLFAVHTGDALEGIHLSMSLDLPATLDLHVQFPVVSSMSFSVDHTESPDFWVVVSSLAVGPLALLALLVPRPEFSGLPTLGA